MLTDNDLLDIELAVQTELRLNPDRTPHIVRLLEAHKVLRYDFETLQEEVDNLKGKVEDLRDERDIESL